MFLYILQLIVIGGYVASTLTIVKYDRAKKYINNYHILSILYVIISIFHSITNCWFLNLCICVIRDFY